MCIEKWMGICREGGAGYDFRREDPQLNLISCQDSFLSVT